MIEKAKQIFKDNKTLILPALVGVSVVGAFLYFQPKTPKDNEQK